MAYNESITGGYRIDILEFYREWKSGWVGYIKTVCLSADKTLDYPLLYQSNPQQYTRNIIAVVTHIARYIERQFQLVFKRTVEGVERTYNWS